MVIVLDGAHVSYVGCCVCSWVGALTLSDVPGGANRVVKEFKHFLGDA